VAATLSSLTFGGRLLALWRQQGRLLNRIEALQSGDGSRLPATGRVRAGLAPGSLVPARTLGRVEGSPVDLREVLDPGRETLLVFISAGCGPCRALLPDIRDWQGDRSLWLSPFVIASGPAPEARLLAEEHGIAPMLLDPARAVAAELGALATPSALLLKSDGTVATAMVRGAAAIRELVLGSRAGLPPPARAPS
jgi:hypothetical protein